MSFADEPPDLSAADEPAAHHVRVDLSAADSNSRAEQGGLDLRRDNSSRARLAELGGLLNDGLITREEFEAKRRAIIDAI